MRLKLVSLGMVMLVITLLCTAAVPAHDPEITFKLGNENLMAKYEHLIVGKK